MCLDKGGHFNLQSITADEYKALLENIRYYLSSPMAQKFSFEYMVHNTLRVILPEYDPVIAFGKDTAELMDVLDNS